jgi:hypothetical protein
LANLRRKDERGSVGLQKRDYNFYGNATAVTTFKEFPNRSHYSIGEPGWQEVADFVLTWAMENALVGT